VLGGGLITVGTRPTPSASESARSRPPVSCEKHVARLDMGDSFLVLCFTSKTISVMPSISRGLDALFRPAMAITQCFHAVFNLVCSLRVSEAFTQCRELQNTITTHTIHKTYI